MTVTAVEHGHEPGHAADVHHDSGEIDLPTYLEYTRRNRLGMWLFFASEAFLFLALLVTRFYLWRGPHGEIVRPELDQFSGLVVTAVLLLSSYFMNRAEISIANNKRKDFLASLLITAVLGTAFLIGVVVWEWGYVPQPCQRPS